MAMAMRELCRSLLKLCFLTGLLFPGVRAQSPFSSVSISVNWPHSCASYCIDTYGLETGNDIGGALGCAAPYANDCYCATSSKAASIATSFFPSCASRVCDSGDLADDLSVMEEIYASYCMNNGFTQPGMTNWYNPATATTEATSSTASTASLAPGTTTKVSYVTQTTTSPPGANSAGTTLPGLGKCLLLLVFSLVGPFVLAGRLLQVLSSPCSLQSSPVHFPSSSRFAVPRRTPSDSQIKLIDCSLPSNHPSHLHNLRQLGRLHLSRRVPLLRYQHSRPRRRPWCRARRRPAPSCCRSHLLPSPPPPPPCGSLPRCYACTTSIGQPIGWGSSPFL